ncbi:hypothetical protein HanRHA438_Chr03g0127011 [Helianthus annuus]|nr:hypothetical protein HanHA300_Chr03g0096081 [Helianthus annuus]KAJ0601222.1 hypothetical protein HanIR_Chr03g0125911 [Helianthus annuus]KAJ0608368.1 hypothetical protein HanHA89_Chr03g0107771 [Helianthus annuus]KAJ0768432.1 hypothetical protein HanLR1_Chr03g0101141 [Helianthus annuus]KAJ0774184.1 hypothetical protein HanOQP8_Chr03g0108681 [Helianthus annuus]
MKLGVIPQTFKDKRPLIRLFSVRIGIRDQRWKIWILRVITDRHY